MQIIKPTVLILSTVSASLSQIKEDLQYWIPRTIENRTFVEETKFRILEEGDDIFKKEHVHVVGNIEESIMSDLPSTRALINSDLSFLLEDLSSYGCWCFFEDGMATQHMGRGHPVNDVDQMCKSLMDGYACSGIDSKSASFVGEVCEPWNVEYNSGFDGGFGFFGTEEELGLACEQRNGGTQNCAYQGCIIEGNFVRDIILEVTVNGYYDLSKKHTNGFEHSLECPHSEGGQAGRECCGTYPNRFPFSTKRGSHGCCGQSVFDVNMFTCCSDFTVQFVCD